MKCTTNPRRVMAAALFTAITLSALPVGAQTADPAKPMAFRSAMDKLGRDMQAVTGAISREDWALVAELVPKIAHHDEPPAEELKAIHGWLGSNGGKFHRLDEQTHKAAVAMGNAAKRGNGKAVISAFEKVQQSCLACHQSFRKSFVEHFYAKR